MAFSLDDIPDQTGKVIVITGASSGIGLEATRMLVAKNATVYMACRSVSKAEPLAKEINEANADGAGKAVVVRMDTTELDSIDSFADALSSEHGVAQVHGLLLNAGIMMVGYRTVQTRSAENPAIESQMGCNVVGHFYVAMKLLPFLQATPNARVVSVSSLAAQMNPKTDSIDYDVFLGKNPGRYDAQRAYCNSKLGNLLIANELQRRFESNGSDILSIAAHPGYSRTPLQDRVETLVAKVSNFLFRPFSMGADGGGLVIATAVAIDKQHVPKHAYFLPNGFLEATGAPKADGNMPATAWDEGQAKKLWECCEELCGIRSPI